MFMAHPFEKLFEAALKKSTKEENLVVKEDFIKEFTLLLIEYAQEYYDKDIREIPVPNEVKFETNEYINDNNPAKEWIDKNIIITGDEKDIIKTSDILLYYNNDLNNETKMDSKNMVKIMNFNGINVRPVRYAGSRVYYKIKLVNSDENI